MALDYASSLSRDINRSRSMSIKLKQILSDSTNIDSDNVSSNIDASVGSTNHRHHRRRQSLKLAAIHLYQQQVQRKKQLIEEWLATKQIKIETDIVNEIKNYQQESIEREQQSSAILRREIYNKKQTPLIALIMDDEFLSSLKSASPEQDQLLYDLLTLLNSIDNDQLKY